MTVKSVRGCRHADRLRGRRGVALLAALWLVLLVGGAAFAAAALGRESLAATRNRAAATQAAWRADGCAAEARARLADVFASAGTRSPAALRAAWLDLPGELNASGAHITTTACAVSWRTAGSAIDLNRADSALLDRAMGIAGVPRPIGDSIVTAILAWPSRMHRPFEHARELLDVTGMDRLDPTTSARLVTLFDADAGPVTLLTASADVLRVLPGIDAEATHAIAAVRLGVQMPTTVAELALRMPLESRTQFEQSLPALVSLATLYPEAWLLTVRARAGTPAVTAVLELRLVRDGTRLNVARRRQWNE